MDEDKPINEEGDNEGESVGVGIEDEKESEEEYESFYSVMNVKRGSDRQPLLKNAYLKANPPTKIKELLNRGP